MEFKAVSVKGFFGKLLIELSVKGFMDLINSLDRALIIHGIKKGGILGGGAIHIYLTPYQGIIFFCKTKEVLELPKEAVVIEAEIIEPVLSLLGV